MEYRAMNKILWSLSSIPRKSSTSLSADAIDKRRGDLFKPDKIKLKRGGDFGDISEIGLHIRDGVHYVIINGVRFPFLWIKGKGKELYVLYKGARQGRNSLGRYLPTFPHWGFYRMVAANFLYFDDPMFFIHSQLALGWFYGTKERSFIADTVGIIERFLHVFNIPNRKVTFLSALGGGYAALYASTWLPGSMSISIDPPLRLASHWQAHALRKIAGIDLEEQDILHRNNIKERLNLESKTSHVILVNAASPAFERDVLPLARELGVSLEYGLARHRNILFWMYNCPASHAGNAFFTTPAVFYAIEYIANIFHGKKKLFKGDNFIPAWLRNFTIMVNEAWHEIGVLNAGRFEAAQKNTTILDTDVIIFDKLLFPLPDKIAYKEDSIKIGPSNSDYFYKSFDILQDNAVVIIKFVKPVGIKQFEIAIYSSSYKHFYARKQITISENKDNIYVSVVCGNNCGDLSFLVYAGMMGHTVNKSLFLEVMEVYVMPDATIQDLNS